MGISATRRATAWLVVTSFLMTAVGAPGLPGPFAISSARAADNRPGLALFPLARRGDVGVLAVARIEEYLRAMIEAGTAVRLISPEIVDLGRDSTVRQTAAARVATPAQKALDKADQALLTGRTMLDSGDDTEIAYKLMLAAIKRYEAHFVELIDFTKLVDAYSRAASAALVMGNKRDASDWLERALTIQPTFVVDARRANKQLQSLVNDIRAKFDRQKKATISVACEQSGATAYVDGVRIGATPATSSELPPGIHYVQVRMDGTKPWGETVKLRGRSATVKATLEQEEGAPDSEISLMVKSADLKPFAAKGGFQKRLFRNFSTFFARQIQAEFLLYGVVAPSIRGLELHLFLFESKERRVAALEPVMFAGNLNNLQMKILEAEGRIRSAVALFPADREVTAQPEVYERTTEAAAAEPPPVIPSPPPRPEPERVVQPDRDEPRRSVVVQPDRNPSRRNDPQPDPYAGLVSGADDDDGGIVTKWWFWTTIGVVVVGGAVAAALIATQEQPVQQNFKAQASFPTIP